MRVSIVGAGAVGRSLTAAACDGGHAVTAIVSRTVAAAREIAGEFDVPNYSTNLKDALTGDVILLAVPDSAIDLVSDILDAFGKELDGKLVMHTSGLVPAAVLGTLVEHGAIVASFHPLQTFSRERVRTLRDLPVAVEGSAEATTAAEAFAKSLGAAPFRIPTSVKATYHLVASVLSNYSVALAGMASQLLMLPGMPPLTVYERLVESTWANVFSRSAGAALTGPIARGDFETVQAHLHALPPNSSLESAYRALGVVAAGLARQNMLLDEKSELELVSLLESPENQK